MRSFSSATLALGRIGLSGGRTWIDKVITRAERHLDEKELWGRWSHAFIFRGAELTGSNGSLNQTSIWSGSTS